MAKTSTIIFRTLIVLVVIVGFFVITNITNITNLEEDKSDLTPTDQSISPSVKDTPQDSFSSVDIAHWSHMPITYKIESGCTERQNNLTRNAFKTIESETNWVVWFNEVNSSPDISLYCQPMKYAKGDDLQLGYATFNTEPQNNKVIIHAEVNIYGQGMSCGTGYPALEVHEILHTFGFDNDAMLGRIMSSYSAESTKTCQTKNMDKTVTSCLGYIYSNGVVNGTCPEMLGSSDMQSSCPEGSYEVKGTTLCCPEPNMIIKDGYCFN